MKNSSSIRTLSGILWALTFGVFLLWGTLTSSDFNRGLYGPPDRNDAKWPEFDSLNQNIVWNYRHPWKVDEGITVHDYLDSLDAYGMKAILRKEVWDPDASDNVPFPLWAEYRLFGSIIPLQVELDYERALNKLENACPGYYFFWHDTPRAEVVCSLPGAHRAVVFADGNAEASSPFLKGPYSTIQAAQKSITPGKPYRDWDDFLGYALTGGRFHSTIRVAMDTTGCGVSDTTTVLEHRMILKVSDDSEVTHSHFLTVNDFDHNLVFEEFSFEGDIEGDAATIHSQFLTTSPVDLYVDWVKYGDRDPDRQAICHYIADRHSGRPAVIASRNR